MTRGLGRRSGAAAVVLTALLVAVPASPAAAEVIVTIDSPKADALLETSSATVSGKATSDAPLLNTIRRITVTVKGKAPVTVDCADTPCPYSVPVATPANGPYEVTVAAVEANRLLGIEGATGSQVRKFAVEAPPAKPVLDPPKVTDARQVQLSWTRNTEPDMLYYVVFRKDPGAADYVPVSSKVDQPASGAKVTFTDTSASATAGGDYAYLVAAVRMGRSGTDKTEAKAASAAKVATVPVPPTTSTTAAAPGATPASTGPTTTVKAGTSAGVDLSGFLNARSQPVALPPITVPEPPDTGFKGTLPFGARPPGDDLEEGSADAVPPSGRRATTVISDGARSRPLVPIAGGLVLLLVALHLRMLNRKVKAPAERDLPVDRVAPVAPAPVAAAAAPAPAPEPPAPYDILDDDDWDAEWAAAVAELDAFPEPEPEPEPEPAPEPEPDLVTLWAPTDAPPDDAPDDDRPDVDPNEIEVFEVVSPVPRRLVRAGRP